MKGLTNGYYVMCVWVLRLFYVNFLWIAFAFLGLLVFGFFPATTAMFAVVRKWLQGEKDIKIFAVFWNAYRKEFWKANLLGYILTGIGYLLSIEFQILRAQESSVYFISSYGVIALFILYFIVMMYVFPIFVHFNLKIHQYISWSFIIGIVHPILTVFLIAVIAGVNYVAFTTIPALVFFFGGSVSAYILMWGASKTFNKYEKVAA